MENSTVCTPMFFAKPVPAPRAFADRGNRGTRRPVSSRRRAPDGRRAPSAAGRRAVSKPLASTDAVVIDVGHAYHVAHFKEARARAIPAVVSQRASVFDADRRLLSGLAALNIGVGQVGGSDQRLPVIAAVGDDGGDGILHPIGNAVRAQVVEQEDFAVERHAVSLLVGGVGTGVVARADAVEQSLEIREDAFKALLHDAAEGGHGEVGLAGAGFADQKQAGILAGRERVGVVPHLVQHALEFLHGIGLEILKRRAAIKRRDLGALLQPFGAALGKASAAFGARDARAFDDDPAGAAALFANRLRGHYFYYGADARGGRWGFGGAGDTSPAGGRAVRTAPGQWMSIPSGVAGAFVFPSLRLPCLPCHAR